MTDESVPTSREGWDGGPLSEASAGAGLTYHEAEAILQLLARVPSPAPPEQHQPGSAWTERAESRRDPGQERAGREQEQVEEQLRRAEARYRTLVEQIPAVTFMASLDAGDPEVYVSPQIEALLGFTQKEWLEDPFLWYNQLHPDDRQRWHDEFARTCARGVQFRSEYRFLARDGRVVWVHGEARVVRDDDGRPLFLQGIAFDITDRKRAEEEKFRRWAESNIIGVTFGEGTIITEANDEFLRIVGYSRDDLRAGKLRWPEMTPPEYLEQDRLAREEAFRRGVCTPFKREYIRKDGSRIPVLIGRALLDESQSNWVAFVLDLTERERAQEALHESEARFEAFMRNLPGTALIKDLDGRYVYVNQRLEEIHGRRSGDWLGKRDDELWPAETAAQFQASDRRVLASGSSLRTIETAQQDGAPHHWLVHKFPIPDKAGKPSLLGEIAVDITEQKQIEEELTRRARQQAAIAELSQWALTAGNLSALLNEAVAAIARTLEVAICSALELLPGGEALLIKAGVGWEPGVVGRVKVPFGARSPAGYALLRNEPLVFDDLQDESRFLIPTEWRRHGIVSGAVVVIAGRDRPFGALHALSTCRRAFTRDDLHFLQAVANIIAAAVRRWLLEKEILDISEREQRRIGQDLHDGVCQHLVGVTFFAEYLQQTLAAKALPEARKATEMAQLLRDGVEQVREIARGLSPVDAHGGDLVVALRELAGTVERSSGLACRYRASKGVAIPDSFVAGHLFRIAQEALNNAVRHGRARNLSIELGIVGGKLTLTVKDDGIGLPKGRKAEGMGLHTMRYRAAIINASLSITRGRKGGTTVSCALEPPTPT